AIAFGYWEKLQYRKAGEAYGRAPATPKHLYRAARGLWLGGRETEAIAAYKRLVTTFPDGGDDTALGLLRLARLVNRQEAIAYLDTLMQKYPDKAPDALVEKAKALEALGSTASAQQARQSVLTQHSNSDAAAELRWQAAQTFAAAGNLKEAWAQASKLTEDNPQSDRAPQAAYWIGKWAQALQKDAEAAQAYKHLLKQYPGSYYAWRAAVKLGWEVGDFQTVRQLNPAVVRSLHLDPPPAGSDLLQELYQLGQFRDAWMLWQVEFTNPKEPTVAEQFTDGLVRLGIGDNLDGMFMVSSLDFRDRPEEVAEVEALKQQPAYWEALYPFPYLELILRWSQERQLNPVLVTALIRQESRFMPAIESVAGAMGLMQVMPDTGSWVAGKIGLDAYALDNPDNNIQLGTWYLDYTHQEYSNNSLLAVASYNAGPGNVADWLARFGFDDPDVFVERIPFDETRDYVEKVFGNYWNYLRLYNPQIQEQLATLTATSDGTSDRTSDKKSNPTSEATEEPSP
ncbi:MAG: transglycosylase SLT domain-containing protein, partial [Coleofasciculaceae cyanobacterium SM2_3_26]|nr:transglycosylase SLT domain-containing protein [Coleofasciculaceae cyanobacterium SM2_3_26]